MQSNLPGQKPHPLLGLLGKFDYDPGRYRPLIYGLSITVGDQAGDIGRGSVSINNQPWVMTKITHQITGPTADPETSGLYQDGQYLIEFKDEQSNYQNQPIPADILFGSVRSGFIIELPYPIPFAGNKTLTFNLTNLVTRTLTVGNTFDVHLALHGCADWGPLSP
jgi:hypothetical protein